MPEILAPAGGPEQLTAAVRSGADAVYLGTGALNARRSAKNFNDEELLEAVRYCHAYGVRVYVTLNTLVFDNELEGLRAELQSLAEAGVDAVIVQDLAVAALVRDCCPSLPLHASTQMTVHNAAGAQALEGFGFRRIVLARELTLAEIRAIAAATACEIEVFVHGAHCMSVSGTCYFSSLLGGRSGNRGLCAQPCRLRFVTGENREFALSLKDMCLLESLPALAEAGVCSFKIEGRMKRPEYVAAAVDACKKAANGEPPDLATLQSVFSRSGFTDGYLRGKRDLSMFGYRTKDDVEAAAGVFGKIAGLYRAERQNIPVTATLTMHANEPTSLTLTDGRNNASVAGDIPQPALTRPMDEEYATRSLSKLGNTPFYLKDCVCILDEGLTLPGSALNALRRDAAEALYARRAQLRPHPFAPPVPQPVTYRAKPPVPTLRLQFTKAEQLFDDTGDAQLLLPVAELAAHPELLSRLGNRLTAVLPALVWQPDEDALCKQLQALQKEGLTAALCENIGMVQLARTCGLHACGGTGLNICNAAALREYGKLGVEDATLSFELSFEQIAALRADIPVGLLAYGRLPLMRFRCCPMQTPAGCAACPGNKTLTDRTGTTFTVLCEHKKFQTLLNAVPLYVGDRHLPPVDFATLYFTTESAAACRAACEAFRAGIYPPFPRTNGLYNRTVL